MEGVTILNSIDITRIDGGWLVGVSLLAFCFLMFLIWCLELIRIGEWYAVIPGIIGAICFIAFIYVTGPSVNATKPTGKYEYEVLLSEDVSFTELYKKYEVVEQRGKIWVLKDKEDK